MRLVLILMLAPLAWLPQNAPKAIKPDARIIADVPWCTCDGPPACKPDCPQSQ